MRKLFFPNMTLQISCNLVLTNPTPKFKQIFLLIISPFHSVLPALWVENADAGLLVENPGPEIQIDYSGLRGAHDGLWVENAGPDIRVEYSGLSVEDPGL